MRENHYHLLVRSRGKLRCIPWLEDVAIVRRKVTGTITELEVAFADVNRSVYN